MRTSDALDVAFALGWLEDDEPWRFERDGKTTEVELPLDDPSENGLEFEPDRPRICPNNCVFCFVDQLPPGLRRSLYVKDEDFRLSFTCGNYITLTNLDEDAFRRIERQRLSPLYVSVHATDDEVRRMLLGNPQASPVMPALKRLADSGITLHGQIVVCPGLNDGVVLAGTLHDLSALAPALATVAVVPVGLTEHREGLFPLTPFTREDARSALGNIERASERTRKGPAFYASDEIYLLAERELPPYEYYGDFEQIENGVGLLRLFERGLQETTPKLAGALDAPLHVVLLTGTLAAPFIEQAARESLARHAPVDVSVVPVENRFLGRTVTVAGLLSGDDLARALREAPEADLYLLPGEALNPDGVTLDDQSVDDIARRADREPVRATNDLVEAILRHAEGKEESR